MLQLKNITFKVKALDNDDEITILDDISFEIETGKILVITGPNGGGKSTLAKIIMGIEKPTSGTILFNGKDITNLSITDRARLGIGYAFQQPPRFKGVTVEKLLQLAAGKHLDEEKCCEYLSKVGLCSREYLKRDVDNSLSGGELKRIEIASLMARNPKISIYDEPEAGIDLWSFSMLVDTFTNFKEESDEQSIVIISHQERIIELADYLMIIADGKIETIGYKDEILPLLQGGMKNCLCQMKEVALTHERYND
ncbi:MAG: ATP-binding cassette domain-containing protein [Terrisporobacter sp.]